MTYAKSPALPSVDALIPAYNAAETIVGSLNSIQSQVDVDLRIVVVDDGSTDETPLLLAELARNDHRIRIVTQANEGIVSALNKGLTYCRSEFVARHDADDLALPQRLSVQLAYLESHPDCVAVAANAWHIDRFGDRLATESHFKGDVDPDPYAVPTREPYLIHPLLTVRRHALVRVNGYRYVFHAEDTDLYWRLLAFGRLHNLEQKLGEHRLHAASVSSVSVVNGRVQATMSQLSALSERRRRSGSADIRFPFSQLARYKVAADFERIIDVASEPLTDSERAFLEIAASLKLLELASFRAYGLEIADYEYIKRAIAKHSAGANDSARAGVTRAHARAAAHLLERGKLKEFLALSTVQLFPRAIFTAVTRLILNAGRRLQRRLVRSGKNN
jgi:glycosyltransferase involved in cell wall biosynthesis